VLDREVAVQRARALFHLLEAPPPALARRVVGDRRLDAAVLRLAHLSRTAPAAGRAHRLVHSLADDLVQRRLRLLRELLRGVDVEVDAHVVRQLDLIGERADGGREALVAENDRLEVERQAAQLTDRRAVRSSARPMICAPRRPALLDRVQPASRSSATPESDCTRRRAARWRAAAARPAPP
jgi:hypothetical protein